MRISIRALLAAAVFILFAVCIAVSAQRRSSGDLAARIIQMQHEIAAAIVARDIAALDRCMPPTSPTSKGRGAC
jgi:hypothetical protein